MKRLLRRLAKVLGYEVRRLQYANEGDPFRFARTFIETPRPIVFDVGAHDGATTRHLRALFRHATIHSFEPFPESFRLLQLATNGDPQVKIHPVALSNRRGTATLTSNVSAATNSMLPTDPKAVFAWGNGLLDTQSTIGIQTRTIDDFCDEQGVEYIDLLKIDTQGAEFAVLEGAVQRLSRHLVRVLIFELITVPTYEGQRTPADYFGLLQEYGYAFSGVFGPLYRNGVLAQCDVAFLPRP